jgi:hypothetical protein
MVIDQTNRLYYLIKIVMLTLILTVLINIPDKERDVTFQKVRRVGDIEYELHVST